MKKLMYLLIALAAQSMSCSSQQPLATTPDGRNPLTITAEGNTVTCELIGNATTGYTWACKIRGKSVKVTSDEYQVPQREDGTVILGQPGKHKFVLEAVEAGKSSVTFDYAQHWKNGKTSGIRMVEISVDQSLAASAKEIE